MGELKFRAWDKRDNEMFYSSMYQDKTSMVFGLSSFLRECSDIEETLMQCTGLVDKNKTEAWNGDIIQFPNGVIATIEYNLTRAEWICRSVNRKELVWNLADSIESEAVIIGNIYESPELLKENQGN